MRECVTFTRHGNQMIGSSSDLNNVFEFRNQARRLLNQSARREAKNTSLVSKCAPCVHPTVCGKTSGNGITARSSDNEFMVQATNRTRLCLFSRSSECLLIIATPRIKLRMNPDHYFALSRQNNVVQASSIDSHNLLILEVMQESWTFLFKHILTQTQLTTIARPHDKDIPQSGFDKG